MEKLNPKPKLGMNSRLTSGKHEGKLIKNFLLSTNGVAPVDHLRWLYDNKKVDFDDYVKQIINRI